LRSFHGQFPVHHLTQVENSLALVFESLDVARLMLEASFYERVNQGVVPDWTPSSAVGYGQFSCCAVTAGKEIG